MRTTSTITAAMATEQETLKAEVKELRLAVVGLVQLLDEKVQTKVETEVREQAVPRQELHDRLRASAVRSVGGLILVLLLAVGAIAINRVTLMQAQKAFGEQITRCFLRPGAISAAAAAACDREFSAGGHEYQQIQQRSAAANRQFADLQRWAESKGWKPPK